MSSIQEWVDRINEFLLDIGKEEDEFADQIFELLINATLDIKDARQDEEDMGPAV